MQCIMRNNGILRLLLVSLFTSLQSLVSAETAVVPYQVSILMDLKNSLEGNTSYLSSWNEYNDCSEWLGLTCDENGFVIELNLYSMASELSAANYLTCGYAPPPLTLETNQLKGTISESIGNLSTLQKLYLSGNTLSGAIPSSIGNLAELEILDLSNNFLDGVIPASISNLSKLRLLFLSYNSLTGSIPHELGNLSGLHSIDLSVNYLNSIIPDSFSSLTNLRYINLGDNNFAESMLPPWITNMTHLQHLDFRGTNLMEPIPVLDNLFNLSYIDLSNNMLNGSITNQFSKLNALNTLLLSCNSLTGPISSDLGNLPLQYIDLSRNAFTGDIPSVLGQLGENLKLLDLTSNSLNGTIPSSISNLSSLTSLSFGSNHLTGIIPKEISEMTNIIDFIADGNFLTGTIPLEIGKLANLDNLILSNNKLFGPIPNSISQLSNLRTLLIDNNTFTGQLPPEFGDLRSLEVLDASHNVLSGVIPASYGKLSNLTNLRLLENSIQGSIPDLSNLTKLIELDLSLNALTGSVPNNLSPSLIKLNLRSNFLSSPVASNLLSRLPNLTTLDLSSNELTSLPSLKKVSNSLSFISLSYGQFTEDTPSNITQETSLIQIFGRDCSITDTSCLNRISDYLNTSLPCNTKCLGYEQVSPILYVNPQNCPCSPPFIVKFQLYAPLFYIFNEIERNNVRKHFANLLGYPESQVKVENATAVVSNQVRIHITLYIFTNDTNPWTPKDSGKISNALYYGQRKRDNPRMGPYMLMECMITEKAIPVNKPLPGKESKGKSVPTWLIIIVALLSAFSIITVILLVFIFVGIYGRRKKIGKLEEDVMKGMARAVSFPEVQQATKYFSERHLLGVGGFGSVYKGITKTGELWAVKRAKKVSLQSKFDFENEVLAISRMDHINLVKLLGYCDEQNEQILIYEFMSRGTLRDALDSKRAGVTQSVLTFEERLHIAAGAASGLNYLHSGATQPIIHRDIKSENILLDENLTTKVADFGLLKKNSPNEANNSENLGLAGTPGYMDPEYYATWKVTTKSDVYSFGIVLLELLTGKPPILVDRTTCKTESDLDVVPMITVSKWAVPYIETSKVPNIIDPLLEGNYDLKLAEAFAHVALGCVRKKGNQRPDMDAVTSRLHSILKSAKTGVNLTENAFSIATSEVTGSQVMEPLMSFKENSYGASGFYAPSNIMDGR